MIRIQDSKVRGRYQEYGILCKRYKEIPARIENIGIRIPTIWSKALGSTSVSQMSPAQRALKYYGISKPPAENGLTYDTAIDIAIISELSVYDQKENRKNP
ncbi:MAG: hypothetical protein WCF23_00015 [Candidatus Nitrosopolaris sp.]